MTSISVPVHLYRQQTLKIVKPDQVSAYVRPLTKRRRTVRSLRERALYDSLYIRHQIV